ncbi:acetate uptake transporter [Desulfovirgula thermocuniculi]|uniref:acetate uptake transporter n=1 Tax=Desulfovirgula thermocuniculi TaxID=348842 RepID=UPI0024815BFF|nr:acetate uptake transporter [Desulfovirgula thermocuniculi]
MACFALTTFCLSLINAGIVSKQSLGVVIALALVYGGTVQILAGMWEFKKNNVFGATALSSYGGFWVAFGIMELLSLLKSLYRAPRGGADVPGGMDHLYLLHVNRQLCHQ